MATGGYHLRPLGRPVIEGFFGRRMCDRIMKATARCGFRGADDLAGVLGNDIRKIITPLASTAWRAILSRLAPLTRAAGHAGDRAILAAPVEDRIFFAGEATLRISSRPRMCLRDGATRGRRSDCALS